MTNKGGFSFGTNGIMGIITLILGFILLFFIAKGVFTLLSWAAPFLLLGALIVNWRTVAGYGKFILNLFKRNIIMAIVAVVLTVIGFPIVAGFLFGKSFLDRKVAQLRSAQEEKVEGEYVEYEDLTEDEVEPEILELPEIEPLQQESDYDDFFEDPKN